QEALRQRDDQLSDVLSTVMSTPATSVDAQRAALLARYPQAVESILSARSGHSHETTGENNKDKDHDVEQIQGDAASAKICSTSAFTANKEKEKVLEDLPD
ncbi:unnamed protein product, partial [Amoebophrya sp. A25]